MAFRKLFDNPLWGNHAPQPVTARSKAPSPGDNAEAIAAAEAAAIATARQATTQAMERALAAVLAEVVKTAPLCDEARERITELMGAGDDDS